MIVSHSGLTDNLIRKVSQITEKEKASNIKKLIQRVQSSEQKEEKSKNSGSSIVPKPPPIQEL